LLDDDRMVRILGGAILLVSLGALAPARADAPKVALALQNHQFVPAELAIPANTKVELVISNRQQTPAEFESSSLHREKVVPPGATASVFVGPLDPGKYEFFDDFNSQTRGHLVVK
jgi:hypothetical protein